MRIAVFGGTGLIGSRVVRILNAGEHDAVPYSPSTGVDLVSEKGLPEAVKGADVVVNLTNSPTSDQAALVFFRQTMENLLLAAEDAEVGHVVVLSVIGAGQVPDVPYFRAKALQEELLSAGPVPFSIVRSTQVFEAVDGLLAEGGNPVRLPATHVQPIAAADLAWTLAEVSAGVPLQGVRSIAGPEVFTWDQLGRITLSARGDQRTVVAGERDGLFAEVPGDVLLPGTDAVLASTTVEQWLAVTGR